MKKTLADYYKEIDELQEANKSLTMENSALKTLLEKIIRESDCIPCDYCKNNVPCIQVKCDHYCSGVGDAEGKYPNFKWSCEDFHFGTCPKMEKTKCNGCMDNNYSAFELEVKLPEDKIIQEINIDTIVQSLAEKLKLSENESIRLASDVATKNINELLCWVKILEYNHVEQQLIDNFNLLVSCM